MDRIIATTIDSITALILDSLSLPPHARPTRLQYQPATRLLALELEADTPIFPDPEITLGVQLRRLYPVSGATTT